MLLIVVLALVALASTSQIPMVDPGSIYAPQKNTVPTLADLLTIEPSASIFYSYARETKLSELFDGETPMTALVPTNRAIIALPRKPHQGSARVGKEEEGIVFSEQEHDKRSRENVERWVSAHLVPESPILLSSTYPTLLHNKSVSFELVDAVGVAPEWSRAVVDGAIRVVGMKKGLNGVMYLIDGAISADAL